VRAGLEVLEPFCLWWHLTVPRDERLHAMVD
jgi:hypothetical protein